MVRTIRLFGLALMFASALFMDSNAQDKDKKPAPDGEKPVKGLVAVADIVLSVDNGDSYAEVIFTLKNVSDKPITICDYVGNRPLKVEWTDADGKKLKSKHYDWLAAAFIPALSEKNFITIPAGASRRISPRGDKSGIIFQAVAQKAQAKGNVAAPGMNRVTVSFVNMEDGSKFKQKNVWTGTVTAAEVTFKIK